jgi:hypothetical protein
MMDGKQNCKIKSGTKISLFHKRKTKHFNPFFLSKAINIRR